MSFQVLSSHAVQLVASPGNPYTLHNDGSTLYYADARSVSSSSNDGTVTDGSSLSLTANVWVISAGESLVRLLPADYAEPVAVPALSVTTGQIAAAAVTQPKLATESKTVTVASGATTGTATVTASAIVLGIYPSTNQDQFIKSVAISSTTLTVTLLSAATADNVFTVRLLKP